MRRHLKQFAGVTAIMIATGWLTASPTAAESTIPTAPAVSSIPSQPIIRTDTAKLQFQQGVASNSSPQTSAATVSFLCTVTTQYIYERQSFNYMAIGTKPSVTCPITVDSISILTTIRKQTLFGWTNSPFLRSITYASSLAPTDIAVICTNTKNTLWDAEVTGTAVYKGAQYQATVYPGNAPQTFPCGT